MVAAILSIKLLFVTSVSFPHLLSAHYPVFPCSFHFLLLCGFYSLGLCHTITSVHLLPPPPGYWYTSTSVFFLAGSSHPHGIAASAFSRSTMGRANAFSFPPPSLNPPHISKRFSDFTLFLSAYLCLLFILSSISVLYHTSPDFSADITSSWFPPISYHTFSATLPHLFSFVFPYRSINYGWQPLFRVFLTLYCLFKTIISYLF